MIHSAEFDGRNACELRIPLCFGHLVLLSNKPTGAHQEGLVLFYHPFHQDGYEIVATMRDL